MKGVRDGEERWEKKTEQQEPKAILLYSTARHRLHLRFPRRSLTNNDDRSVGMSASSFWTYRYLLNNASTGSSVSEFTAILLLLPLVLKMLVGRQSGYPSIRHSNEV